MSSVLLIYPYFKPSHDMSFFRFPPLGLGYLAASLKNSGHEVEILDCTFMNRKSAMEAALSRPRDIVGIYCMVTMREDALNFARQLRKAGSVLIAGGPLPSSDPASFTDDFDVVVKGEGEHTIVELLSVYGPEKDLSAIAGIVYKKGNDVVINPPRAMETNLDSFPFPARELLPNSKYIAHSKQKFGYAMTSIMTTRGCPFTCEFCSNAVFGASYRERSPENVVDEIERVLALGYDRVHFGDDVFTLRKERILKVCREIKARRLTFSWECLGRVDSIDAETAAAMRDAGCDRIFFGIESGNNEILKLIGKKITVESARRAVESAHDAGIRAGAFFILCYPGETDKTVLETIRFATSLPLDYLSFTLPYPLPGTALHARVKSRISKEWRAPRGMLTTHSLIYDADFSEFKMKFAIAKGTSQFWLGKKLGKYSGALVKPLEKSSDAIFRLLK